MLMFTLAISCLTTSNLPWFMDLTFQFPMWYCSLQHQTLLLSPVTSTTGYCFWFGSISSFFLELFVHWSPVAYWAPIDLGSSPLTILSFLSFHTVHGVFKARILKWFATPFSSGPHSVRPLHDDRSVFGGPIRHALEVSKKRKEKGADNLLEDIMVENFHNEGKETDTQIEEAQRVSNKIDTKTDYN